jgi:hypothetical protein
VVKHFKKGELEALCSLEFHLKEVNDRFQETGVVAMPDDRTNKTNSTKNAAASYSLSASCPSYPAGFIPPHGGCEDLLAYRKSQIIYDPTVRFCDRFIGRRSRTHDQMVQAARSGNKNIAEGSQISGTSKEGEIKLTNVARASLEELLGDYRD